MKKEKKQYLSRGQLIYLYHLSICYEWQTRIKVYLEMLKFNKDSDEIAISNDDLELLFKEGTKEQKEAVIKLGIVFEEDTNAFTRDFSKDRNILRKMHSLSNDLFGNDIMTIRLLVDEGLQGRAFYFNPYKVELSIVNDTDGMPCILKVTKKIKE